MRKQREPETQTELAERLEREHQRRVDEANAEVKALDDAVRRSIKLHGP